MKYIYLNLKRFDVPTGLGGVNRLASVAQWGRTVMEGIQAPLQAYANQDVTFTVYLPEAHILSARAAQTDQSPVVIGCQGVYREDTAVGGNFGAFTTERPAAAAHALGCRSVLIGHCEERKNYSEILEEGGIYEPAAVDRLLNRSIKAAVARGMQVLYCIGEKAEEQDNWQEVLRRQLDIGLSGVEKDQLVIAYEPIWSIGPGRTPAGKEYITRIARFVKDHTGGMPVVYGGGLKQDNAAMLSEISEIDGGLIALTRFSGAIGFYPEEYLEIISRYLSGGKGYKTGI